MTSIGANTSRNIALFILGIFVILGIYLSIRSSIQSNQMYALCSTPDLVGSIEGIVVNSIDRQPISDVHVVIKNITPEKSICSNIGYISEEELVSDDQGHFVTYNTAHPDQYFNITFYKNDCVTSTETNIRGAIFIGPPLFDYIPTFSLDCSE